MRRITNRKEASRVRLGSWILFPGALLAAVLLWPTVVTAQPAQVSWATPEVRSFAIIEVTLGGGVSYAAETRNLRRLPYKEKADSILFVMEAAKDGQGTPLEIVAADDDRNEVTEDPFDSKVFFTPQRTAKYWLVVASRDPDFAGYADIVLWQRIEKEYVELQVFPERLFGTMSEETQFRAGDTFLATKAANPAWIDPSNPAYHDTVILSIDTTMEWWRGCNYGCGTAWFSDNDLGALSSISVTADSIGYGEMGTVFVGAAQDLAYLAPHLMHRRRSSKEGGNWDVDETRDYDGDGLTWELEDALNTCERTINRSLLHILADEPFECAQAKLWFNEGVKGEDGILCNTLPTQRGCWSSQDSDNDGMTDFEEAYGVRRCYNQMPEPGFGAVGACVDADGDTFCDNECEGSYVSELPLSVMDAPYPAGEWRPPSPYRFDVMMNIMYLKTYTGVAPPPLTYGHDHLPPNDVLDQMLYTWEQEPQECNDCATSALLGGSSICGMGDCCDNPQVDCPNDPRYEPRIHLFLDPYEDTYSPEHRTEGLGGAATARSLFNRRAYSARRYTDAFYFGFALDGGIGGQTGVNTRVHHFAPHSPWAPDWASVRFWGAGHLHEMGHDMGLRHGGDQGGGEFERKANYNSLMSGITMEQPQKTRLWDSHPPSCDAAPCAWPDFESCENSGISDGAGGTLHFCIPSGADPNITAWPNRFSRGLLSFVIDEAGDTPETQLPRSWLLFYGALVTSAWDLRIGRFVDSVPPHAFRADCNGPFCDIDLDHDGVRGIATNTDVNNYLGISPDPYTDFDDWGQMLREGSTVLRPEAKSTYEDLVYSWGPIYFAGFNPPDVELDAARQCDAGCVASLQPTGGCSTCDPGCTGGAGPHNLLGWQPCVADQGVTYPLLGADEYGNLARFGGQNSPGSITLSPDPRFEVLTPQGHPEEYRGFRFTAWLIKPADSNPNQFYHGIVENDLFSLQLIRSPSTKSAILVAGFVTNGGWQYSGLGGFVWNDGEQRKVRLSYDHATSELKLYVSAPTANRRDAEIWERTVTFSSAIVHPYALVGTITVGQVSGAQRTLDGFMDDITLWSEP